MANSTDPEELKDLWVGWHTISPPMRDRYARWVELGNKGAKEMGFNDLGAMWRAGYDMTPDAVQRRGRAPVAAGEAAL